MKIKKSKQIAAQTNHSFMMLAMLAVCGVFSANTSASAEAIEEGLASFVQAPANKSASSWISMDDSPKSTVKPVSCDKLYTRVHLYACARLYKHSQSLGPQQAIDTAFKEGLQRCEELTKGSDPDASDAENAKNLGKYGHCKCNVFNRSAARFCPQFPKIVKNFND